MTTSAFITIVLCLSTVYGLPMADSSSGSDYDYSSDYSMDGDYSGDERVILTTPEFKSTPVNNMINEGDTIKLPCFVDKLDGFVLMWKRGKDIVSLGDKLMKDEDPRVKLVKGEHGNTLVISLAEPEDAGEYICQVSTNTKTPEIRHMVRVRVAPEIRPNPSDGEIIVHEGESATLACDVIKGSPAPEITWRRKERKLPDGKVAIRGQSLQYFDVTRKHSGIYICSADNGFGEPVEAEIKLDVQHAPTIEMEHTFIHTKEDDETEVVCTVHSSPQAQITWLKNGAPLPSNTAITSHRGNRHILLLVPKEKQPESTFGVYACVAQNKFGAANKSTEVSGKATPPNFKSEALGSSDNEFVLEWVAESITNITAFKVEYKAVEYDGDELESNFHQRFSTADQQGWTDIQVAPKHSEDHYFTGKHVIGNLKPMTSYVARVSSKNDYGFNSPKVFRFGTKGAAPVVAPTRPSSASSSSSSSAFSLSLSLMPPLLLAMLSRRQ